MANFALNPLTSKWELNTSITVPSGSYGLSYKYLDLCGKNVTIVTPATVVVPFYINVTSTAQAATVTSTADFGTGIYDSTRQATNLSAISGITNIAGNVEECGFLDSAQPAVQYNVTFNGANVTCDTNNIYTFITANFQLFPMLFHVASGAAGTLAYHGTPIMARLL